MTATSLSPEAQAQLAKLATDLANNPKTRKQFVGLVKEIDPSRRFPDVENDEIRDEMRREFERRDQDRKKEAAIAKLEAQRSALKERYDDKAIEEIEKLMEKEGISSYETGAKLYAADLKPAEPTPDIKSGVFQMPSFGQKNLRDANLRQDSIKRGYEVVGELIRNRSKR
jgi:hypothetical protein